MIPTLALIGYSNSGKTALMQQMVNILKSRGYKVAVVKHAAHGYTADVEGTDSWLFAKAGADKVVIASQESVTIHDYSGPAKTLGQIVSLINEVDIILIEGFKNEPGPKVEIFREGFSEELLANIEGRMALVSDVAREDVLPRFSFGELEALIDFIIESMGLKVNNA